MLPVIAIVGRTGAGKTALLERLIPALTARGYRVGTVKHHHGGVLDLDAPGKDTWRHAKAGAVVVALAGSEQTAVFRGSGSTLDEITHLLLGEVDVVLVEGFKGTEKPKIEVVRAAVSPEPLCGPEDRLLALVSDVPLSRGVPVFGPEDAAGVAALVARYLEKDPEARVGRRVELLVDGRGVGLLPFVAQVFEAVLTGLLSTLKGVRRPRRVHVSLRLEE
ncbi:MAG: molybdopterin-guanine dinucleotide biosynthesis protein B [candidate division NC10 bacterium]|nr:molybdopterin-guanine dinucleotide biosynthesis protein B [candidate division NC10 bacterium]